MKSWWEVGGAFFQVPRPPLEPSGVGAKASEPRAQEQIMAMDEEPLAQNHIVAGTRQSATRAEKDSTGSGSNLGSLGKERERSTEPVKRWRRELNQGLADHGSPGRTS